MDIQCLPWMISDTKAISKNCRYKQDSEEMNELNLVILCMVKQQKSLSVHGLDLPMPHNNHIFFSITPRLFDGNGYVEGAIERDEGVTTGFARLKVDLQPNDSNLFSLTNSDDSGKFLSVFISGARFKIVIRDKKRDVIAQLPVYADSTFEQLHQVALAYASANPSENVLQEYVKKESVFKRFVKKIF